MILMASLSTAMYWSNPRKSWTGNIALLSGAANVVIILTGVIATNVRNGTLRVAFDRVQKICLGLGAAVAIFWAVTDRPLVAFASVQVIGLIAYGATARRLWRAKGSSEPLFLWVSVLLSSLSALYPAWVRHDTFSWIYLARTLPATTGMIILIVRSRRRANNS
jgi:hypothetical protein